MLVAAVKKGYVQVRDKMKRQADEEAQAKAELEAAERVRKEREAAQQAREAAALAAARELSEEIRKYNEYGAHLPACHCYIPYKPSACHHCRCLSK
jgi:hypothetical protein